MRLRGVKEACILEIYNILKKTQPFDELEDHLIWKLTQNAVIQEVPPGGIIYQKGSPSKGIIYIVVEGLVEIFVTNEHYEEMAVSLCRPFDFFGETSILADKNYPVSSKTVMKSTLLTLSKDIFQKLILNEPKFACKFSYLLAERMHNLYDEIIIEQSQETTGLDAAAFRKKMVEIMSSPVITCEESTPLYQIASIMTEKNISCIVVMQNAVPVGLVSEHNLLGNVLTKPHLQLDKLTAADVMEEQIITLPPDAFFYQALLDMIKSQQKHILIMDDVELIGIVTLQNLVKSRSSGALILVNDIENQNNIKGLIESRKKIQNVLKALVVDNAPPKEIFEVLTEFNDRLTSKVINIAEAEMEAEGLGLPPVDYCWIHMGSSGRKEQFSMTDQDNGIIYADVLSEKEEEVNQYFRKLGDKVVENLFLLGFDKCKGLVMANNKDWCRSLQSWDKITKNWILNPEPENIRKLTTFLDFRGVYGKKYLVDLLRRSVVQIVRKNPLVLHHLAKDDLEHKIPLGIFNRFITEKSKEYKGEIDLKSAACVHVVDCLRVIALKEGIFETSTLERLKKIVQNNAYPKDDAEYLEAAYQFIMMLRIKETVEKTNQGKISTNHLNPEKLSRRDQNRLKDALLAIANLQKFTRIHYAISDAKGIPDGLQRTYTQLLPSEEEKRAINSRVDRFKNSFHLDTSWDKASFVVFDIKTTGTSIYNGDEIISISGFLIEKGKIIQNKIFNELVNPGRDIPSSITESTGITEKMLEKKPNIYSVIANFLEFAGDSLLVTYDAKMHTEFINFKLKRYCKTKLYHPVIDICNIASILYPLMHHFNLDELLKIHKIQIMERNTSLGDSFMSAQLFLKLMEYMKFRKINSYKELLTYIQAHQALNFKDSHI
jgi:CBS domain-containing protein